MLEFLNETGLEFGIITDPRKDIYTIKSTIRMRGPKTFRTIEIPGSCSLYQLACEIVKSFDFSFDHAYGFFSNIKDKDDSLEAYSSFLDSPNHSAPECGSRCRIYKGTQNVQIKEVFEPTKRMLFFYDYGDAWEFFLECQSVKHRKPNIAYPRITFVKGVAPKQYPEQTESEEDETSEDIKE